MSTVKAIPRTILQFGRVQGMRHLSCEPFLGFCFIHISRHFSSGAKIILSSSMRHGGPYANNVVARHCESIYVRRALRGEPIENSENIDRLFGMSNRIS